VYKLSDRTKAEHVPHARLEQFTKQDLKMRIIESHKSRRPTLLLPADGCDAVRATAASTIASDQIIPDNDKSATVNSALALAGLHCVDPRAESADECDPATETCAVLTSGWACYKTSKSLPSMRILKNLTT
jgi:hypothetical protein